MQFPVITLAEVRDQTGSLELPPWWLPEVPVMFRARSLGAPANVLHVPAIVGVVLSQVGRLQRPEVLQKLAAYGLARFNVLLRVGGSDAVEALIDSWRA